MVGVKIWLQWKTTLVFLILPLACSPQRPVLAPLVPNDPLARMAQANEYLNKGQCDRAVRIYQEIIPAISTQKGIASYQVAEVHTNLGLAYLCMKRLESAIQSFQQALALEPLYHPARNALAIAYLEKGRLEEAERIFLELLKVPDFPQAAVYFNLTRLYIRQGQWVKALFTARKAVDLVPDELGPRLLFAQILEHLDMIPDAIAQYRTIVKKWPHNLEATYHLAQLYEKTGERCEAKRMYARVLELDPVGQYADTAAQKIRTIPCPEPILITPPKP